MYFIYMTIGSSIFYNIGQYGSMILFIISFFLLWNKKTFLYSFLFGFFVNFMLNLILKGIFQQERPLDDKDTFDILVKHGKHFLFKESGIPFDMFGMPSYDLQSCMFSTIFIFLVLQRTKLLLFYLVICIITVYQNIYYNYHTFFQTIVGGIIGLLFAYFIFYLSKEKIKGVIKEKPDDYGPI